MKGNPMADPGDQTRSYARPVEAAGPAGTATSATAASPPAPAAAATPGQPAEQAGPDEAVRPRVLRGTIYVLEHAQDYLAAAVGLLLIILAGILFVSGIVNFVHDLGTKTVLTAAANLLDQLLLVLIIAEIVYTVVLSLREHRLVAQPFIVIGLVAVIRKILFLLSNENNVNTTELWPLIAMVVAFVAGLIAVSRFENRQE
jgi:uncharacterized membrane protein (DUF373 family)